VLLPGNPLPRQGECQRSSTDPEVLLGVNLRKNGDRAGELAFTHLSGKVERTESCCLMPPVFRRDGTCQFF